ncbi:MAG: PAS domain-containing protein [Kofleriaceae bacterium]|nr:PAS domain-containing protein [Kofleriaceae bacterium]
MGGDRRDTRTLDRDLVERLERELGTAHLHQRALIDSIPDIAWMKDRQGRFLAGNRALLRAHGLERMEQVVGKTDYDLSPVELAARYRADDEIVMATRATRRVVERHLDPTGADFWIETIKEPILDEDGEVVGTVGIARNVTERKHAEEILVRSNAELEARVAERTEELARANAKLLADLQALEAAESTHRRLVAILEATTDFVAIAAPDARVLYINAAGRRMVGLGAGEDITWMRIADFFSPAIGRRQVEEAMPAAARDGVWEGEIALRRRDGREISVSQVLLAHRDAAGRPEYFSTIMRDVGEVRGLQQQLFEAQKLEALGRLAGGVAHDFNNLLTVISASVVFARRTLPPEHPASAELAQIDSAATHAAGLTRQLLSFARRQIVAPSLVDVSELVLGADRMLRRVLGADIELVTLASPDLELVRVDPGQLENVVLNLAINARDAMPNGGKLTISTTTVVTGTDEAGGLANVEPGTWIAIRVSDTGAGISADVLPHIFEPFYTTKARGEGTGLGLATSYGIVRQAHGHIRVFSEATGTTFLVLLPSTGTRSLVPVQPAEPVGKGGRETILLVEDEPQVRALAERTLEELGYRVLQAASGLEGLTVEAAYAGPIDLVISDIVMPQMSGTQMVAELTRRRPDLMVLLVSGYAYEATEQGSLPAGTHFLAKPFSPETLARRVRAVLDLRTKGYASQ